MHDNAIHLTLTWSTFRWAGLVLLAGTLISLVLGSWPDNPPRPVGDAMRLVFIPAFIIWLLVLMTKGLLL